MLRVCVTPPSKVHDQCGALRHTPLLTGCSSGSQPLEERPPFLLPRLLAVSSEGCSWSRQGAEREPRQDLLTAEGMQAQGG